jgi:ATP-dependent Clp protease ATP-binding subunit ClpC
MHEAVLNMFSERARQAITLAAAEARALHNSSIGAPHFLLGVVVLNSGAIAELMQTSVNTEALRAQLREPEGAPEARGDIGFGPSAKRALEEALQSAGEFAIDHVSIANLSIGALTAWPEDQRAALDAAVADVPALILGLKETLRGALGN